MTEIEPEPDDWTDPDSVRKLDEQLEHTPPTPEQRALDIVGALLLLLVTSPIFIVTICYYAVRSVLVGGSPYPLHTEQRVSEGDPFTLYKFRTLKNPDITDKDNRVKHFEGGDEETAVGRFLVRTYLDELPQLYNVLRGDMRLVGPRPKPVNVATEERDSKGLRRKFLVRPGLTGPDQLQKGYPDRHTAYEGDYRYIYYQQHWGRLERLSLDLKMLSKTLTPVLKAEGK
jgi:putative colanic acid biosynthesis UDP-glucose lipid carrier transferase